MSQMTLDSLRRVGGGGWKRSEEIMSPMVGGGGGYCEVCDDVCCFCGLEDE